jgi:hypothetical protein
MIALLLAAQLSAIQTPTTDVRLPPNYIAGSRPTPQDIISQLKPTTPCGAAGRVEAGYREPTALYRQGDRPAKFYLGWRDYPDPRGCLVGAKP